MKNINAKKVISLFNSVKGFVGLNVDTTKGISVTASDFEKHVYKVSLKTGKCDRVSFALSRNEETNGAFDPSVLYPVLTAHCWAIVKESVDSEYADFEQAIEWARGNVTVLDENGNEKSSGEEITIDKLNTFETLFNVVKERKNLFYEYTKDVHMEKSAKNIVRLLSFHALGMKNERMEVLEVMDVHGRFKALCGGNFFDTADKDSIALSGIRKIIEDLFHDLWIEDTSIGINKCRIKVDRAKLEAIFKSCLHGMKECSVKGNGYHGEVFVETEESLKPSIADAVVLSLRYGIQQRQIEAEEKSASENK